MEVARNTLTGETQAAVLPLWRSQVAVGVLVSFFFKLLAAYRPEWAVSLSGFEEETTQLIFLGLSAVGDLVALVGRVWSKLQPLTIVPGPAPQ